MSLDWVARQLAPVDRRRDEASSARQGRARSGQIVEGATTDAVLVWLSAMPPLTWWTRQQIIWGTGRSQKAVDWALIYLRAGRLVEISADGRNPRYLRYRRMTQGDGGR